MSLLSVEICDKSFIVIDTKSVLASTVFYMQAQNFHFGISNYTKKDNVFSMH